MKRGIREVQEAIFHHGFGIPSGLKSWFTRTVTRCPDTVPVSSSAKQGSKFLFPGAGAVAQ